MKKTAFCITLALASAVVGNAQGLPGERPEPGFDMIIAHFDLEESQVTCLETNQTAFRDAAAPIAEELRDLRRQVRQAARNQADTTAIQSAMEAERQELTNLRASHVTIAQGCLAPDQADELAELIAAETLAQEVRQAKALLLVESTVERQDGFAGPRGRGPRGRR